MNNFMVGISNQIREWELGSIYWPGLRYGDDYIIANSMELINHACQAYFL